MKLNSEYAERMRAFADAKVRSVLPFSRGDRLWQEICAGYAPGFGTTCSFLVHWMLEQLQVSPENKTFGVLGPGMTQKTAKNRVLLNRDCPKLGGMLRPGDGIATIANSPAFLRHTQKGPDMPRTGDIVIIQSEPYKQSNEHVFVFLQQVNPQIWENGESGQARSTAGPGTVDGVLKRRGMTRRGWQWWADAADGMPSRYVQGWLDISLLDYMTTDWR